MITKGVEGIEEEAVGGSRKLWRRDGQEDEGDFFVPSIVRKVKHSERACHPVAIQCKRKKARFRERKCDQSKPRLDHLKLVLGKDTWITQEDLRQAGTTRGV